MDRIEIAFNNLINLIKSNDWHYKRFDGYKVCLNHKNKDIQISIEDHYGKMIIAETRINGFPLKFNLTNDQYDLLDSSIVDLAKRILQQQIGIVAESQLQTLLN